jgi:hypothetical protein
MTLDNYIKWLKAHERLVIISLAVWFGFHFYGDILNAWVGHDQRRVAADTTIAQVAAQKSQADSQANAQLLQQLSDLKLQYATLSAQVTASSQQRQQQTTNQKKQNDSATIPAIAQRTVEILRVDPKEITVATDGSLDFSASAAHINVNALEDGINAAADSLDLRKQIVMCSTLNGKQEETIAGIQKELADEKISHKADVVKEQDNTKLAVAEGKKQFRRGFKWGFITGAVASSAITIYLKVAKVI